MTCEETQKFFSPYLDGELSGGARAETGAHLAACPSCRARLDETRAVVRGLAMLERPAAPPDLVASINDALLIERAARASRPALSPSVVAQLVVGWIQPRVMPYTVGLMASVLLFFAVFSALRPQVALVRELAIAARSESLDDIAAGGAYDVTKPLTPQNFANSRTGFTTESPSLNPRGALAALAWTPPTGGPGDDDMVVVADVYGNGRATLAAVMEPPRNPRALDELEDALRKNPAFVPASLDRRPQTMRVVFVLQKMNVREASY